MIYRVSKTSWECYICTGCPVNLQKSNNLHHFSVQEIVHIWEMNIDGLLLSVWDRTSCWWLSVALISGSSFQKIIYSAIRCPLHKACFSSCSFLTAVIVAVAGVSAQPGCDTRIRSILVLYSVAVALAASVENMKITVRKRVWRVFNLETLSPPGLTFALACSS